jgi:hypothetical protein
MRALRRVVASVLAAALLLVGPVDIPKRCTECPAGCPMHAKEAGHASTRKQPGCHRTTAPAPPGTVCLRSACGNDVAPEPALSVLALPSRPMRVTASTRGQRVALPRMLIASLDAPEPALHPPRTARV